MNVLLYRPLRMLRNTERAFSPVWSVQQKKKVEQIRLPSVFLKAIKRASSLDIKDGVINYTGKGKAPATARELGYLKSILPNEVFDSTLTRRNGFQRVKLIFQAGIYSFPAFLRIVKLARRMKKNELFSPHVIQSYIFFLIDFLMYEFLINKKKKNPRGVVASSLFSSRGQSLITAAIKENIPSLFILHGACSSTFHGFIFPTFPVHLHLLKSQASLDGIGLKGFSDNEIVFYGLPGETLPLRPIPSKTYTLGICLTYAVVLEDLEKMIDEIQEKLHPETIKIRFHPRDPLGTKYQRENIQISWKEETVQDFAKTCNLIMAGNTSAILEILKVGCPVTYISTLDTLGKDVFGFAAKELVPEFKSISEFSIEKVRDLYTNKHWKDRFTYFDPAYGKERAAINNMVREKVLSVLNQ